MILVNKEWSVNISDSDEHYMNEGLHDHCHAIINWEDERKKQRKEFKYFNIWSIVPEFKERLEKG